jgi:hypothetical protein
MDPLRISDFLQIEEQIVASMAEINQALIQLAKQFLYVLSNAHVDGDMLLNGKRSCAFYFIKIVQNEKFEKNDLSSLRKCVETGVWTAKSQNDEIKLRVEAIADELTFIGL